MTIELDYEIKVEIQERGKSKEKFSVWMREFTKDEKKENDKIVKEFQQLNKQLSKIERKHPILAQKVEAYKELDKHAEVLETLEKQEALSDQLDELLEKMESFGGDDFGESRAKERFETTISGKDVDKLRTYAQSQGYIKILNMLDKAKEGLSKEASTK